MTFSKLVRNTKAWYQRRDLRETLYARLLDVKAVARAVRHRLGREKR